MLRLKELREQRRLNQEGLALKLNVSQSTISAYEIGERVPDLETLIAIANFFNVSLDYLAGLSDLKQQIRQSDLSLNELEHLHTYRQLSDIDKEKIKAYIDGLQSRI
jgi:transcriptional regulator with XRE-family HTH domain